MKRIYLSAAVIAAISLAPAIAQIPVNEPPAAPVAADEAQPAGEPGSDGVTVRGVEPSRVLGAIDTQALVEDEAPASAVEAETATLAGDTTTELLASSETLPDEVRDVVEAGDYTTDDLVHAQLAALQNGSRSDGDS